MIYNQLSYSDHIPELLVIKKDQIVDEKKTSWRSLSGLSRPSGAVSGGGSSSSGAGGPPSPHQPTVPAGTSGEQQPKLRITSPFSRVRRSEERDGSNSPPPLSTPLQLPRRQILIQEPPARDRPPETTARDRRVEPARDRQVLPREWESRHPDPELPAETTLLGYNRFVLGGLGMTLSGDQTTTAAIINGGGDLKVAPLDSQHHRTTNGVSKSSGGRGTSAAQGRSPHKGAGLSRSDSYRRARPLLSPTEARRVFRNSADVSSLDFSQCSLSATMTTEEEDDAEERRRDDRKEAKSGGFFRNLRSQFSFSSLRRKSPKKQNQTGETVKASRIQNLSDISGPNYSPANHGKAGGSLPRMTSTPVSAGDGAADRPVSEPRMTSTPVSNCVDSDRRVRSGTASPSTAMINCASRPPSSDPQRSDSRPPSAASGDLTGGVKFRTAALKNQYQRWSFAEQSLREGHPLPAYLPPGHPAYQTSPYYGYVYANPPGSSSAHLLPHPHLLHHHQLLPPYHHPPPHPHHHHHPHPHYATYGHGAVNPYWGGALPPGGSVAGSRRSSLASLAALELGLPVSSRTPVQAPSPSLYQEWNAGGYGYSLNGGRSPQPLPSPAVQQHANSPRPLPTKKGCECPMCYHSIRNPCQQCGCPSNTVPKSARLNPTGGSEGSRPAFTDLQTAMNFFSPSSDYYSLSPDSPPPPLTSGATAVMTNSSSEPERVVAAASHIAVANTSVPIYAQVHKERTAGGETSPVTDGPEPVKERDSVIPAVQSQDAAGPLKIVARVAKPGPPTARKPSAPARCGVEENRGAGASSSVDNTSVESGSRRHSWAGERKSGDGGRSVARPTTLQEFKRLLAQQTPGPNPHRLSAQEMLKAGGGGGEPLVSSHHQKASGGSSGGGGSLRKKTSPWRDNRFSVIQEEGEQEESRRSRENLLD